MIRSVSMTKASTSRVAIVAGATGLVGRACVDRLCASPTYRAVVALARRPIDTRGGWLEVWQVDFDRLDEIEPTTVDVAFCALGTTISVAGSQEAFRRVDHDYTLAFARFALRGGARQFVLVSSVGAHSSSSNFYLRVKGEVEDALRAMPFEAVAILRPGLLLGDRAESRPAEAVARAVAPFLNPMLIGPLARYRSVGANHVAAAMIATAESGRAGAYILDSPDIEQLASRS
jgi:uncharacterized protein YbjT (DUF2867 family)